LIADLAVLEDFTRPFGLESYLGDVLAGVGLVRIDAIPTVRGPGSETTYAMTDLGRLFLQVVVKGLMPDE
jgi:hypothetical protein